MVFPGKSEYLSCITSWLCVCVCFFHVEMLSRVLMGSDAFSRVLTNTLKTNTLPRTRFAFLY